MPDGARLSVIIVNWNTRDLLRRCLASLRAYPPSVPMEIIVVDNASADGSSAMVREEFPEVALLEPGRNTGYAAGNNLGFAQAKGEYLLTLNPDTEVFDGTLDEALRVLDRSPRAGSLGAKLIGVGGEVQRSVRGFPTLVGVLGDITGLARRLPGSVWDQYRQFGLDLEAEAEVDQPMGTFLLFRRQALAQIGDPRQPFDEGFPIFFNEVDLLARLAMAGWTCIYAPSVRVLHHGGESTKQVRKSMIWESHRSLVRYWKKHWPALARYTILPILAGLIYGGALVRARGYDVGFRA